MPLYSAVDGLVECRSGPSSFVDWVFVVTHLGSKLPSFYDIMLTFDICWSLIF